jgi:hypothetical protein
MEVTGIDGTTIELFSCAELAEAFGVPSGGTKPKLRMAAHVRTASRRWIAAAVGGYRDGENTLADELEGSFTAARVQVIVAGKVLERETAKTPAGERTLPLDDGTVNALLPRPPLRAVLPAQLGSGANRGGGRVGRAC